MSGARECPHFSEVLGEGVRLRHRACLKPLLSHWSCMRTCRQIASVSVAICCVLWIAATARAGGFEYVGPGAQALGRGGAVAARADDPMVLLYNPAGLVELRGFQLLVDVNASLTHTCVGPVPGGLSDHSTCGRHRVGTLPQVAGALRIHDKVAIGAGVLTPTLALPGRFGERDGLASDGTAVGTRYQLIDYGTLGVFPTAGIGIKLAEWLRIGGALEWGIFSGDQTLAVRAIPGTDAERDTIARVHVTDWFVPAFTGSVHFVPAENLDVVGAVRVSDDLRGSGRINFRHTSLVDPAYIDGLNGLGVENSYKVTKLTQHLPWKLRGGIRYASRLAPRPKTGLGFDQHVFDKRVHDAFEDERWDIEGDAEYQINSRNDRLTIRYEEQPFFLPSKIEKHWRDQISLRAGGSYNVLPGRFGVSAGVHYETRGADPDYAQIDFMPFTRFGLHAGVKFRFGGKIDVVASYAHIFQETVTVNSAEGADTGGGDSSKSATLSSFGIKGTARLQQIAAQNDGAVINPGKYRSSFDVFAFGVNLHY